MATSIRVALGVDGAREFQNAMQQSNAAIKNLDSQLKLAQSQFDKNDKSTSNLKQQNEILNQSITQLNDKLQTQEAALAAVTKEFGSSSTEAQKLEAEINKTKTAIANSEKDIKNNEEAMSKWSGAAEKMKTAGAAIGKAVIAAGAAAAAAAVKIGKAAIDAYADYEQLTGGVETLFGESSDKVQEYANNAYKNAGLSANEYMEQVTSFSASLLQGMSGDTDKAADIADMAMRDMSDNANKMGTDMSAIQSAYQGFAKGQYQLLDNLKLGYGGTKTEMERLLADAEAFSGVHYDINNLADVYSAIHVVQEEMGITGTTATEASTTISGATGQMKSAWQNLLVSLAADNDTFGENLNAFIESVVVLGENLIPRIESTMDGIGKLLTSFAETILPKVVQIITDNLPAIVETGINIIIKLIEGLAAALPDLVAAVPEIIESIVKTILESLPELKEAGIQLIQGLWEGIKSMKEWIGEKVRGFMNGIVDGVKGVLGIHSPSKVFAGIGENMALGIGVGFGDTIDKVERGMSIGIPNISTADAMAGVVNGMQTAMTGAGGNYNINLVTPDGAVMARWVFNPLTNYARSNGTPIVNPT